MDYKIIVAPSAQKDLKEIFTYYEQEFSKQSALKVLKSIDDTITMIGTMPDSWGTLNDKVGKKWIKGEIIRMVPSKQYWIFYLVRSDTVHILRIRHSSTNWLNELENLFRLMPK